MFDCTLFIELVSALDEPPINELRPRSSPSFERRERERERKFEKLKPVNKLFVKWVRSITQSVSIDNDDSASNTDQYYLIPFNEFHFISKNKSITHHSAGFWQIVETKKR